MDNDFSYLTNIETAINNKFNQQDSKYDMHELQLFVQITKYSYYPAKFSIDEDNNIKIKKDPKYNNLNFHIGSKHQFLHHQYIISNEANQIDLKEDFKTGWNPKKFLIFLNGFLLNNNLLIFIIPNFENDYNKKKIFSTVTFKKGDLVDIYYVESDDDYSQVPLISNIRTNQIKYTAEFDNQAMVRIPYPQIEYKNFYIVNDEGKYLTELLDYMISTDRNHIILSDENKLKKSGLNSLYFTFPNIQNQNNNYNKLSTSGKLSSIKFITQISISDGSASNGIIHFQLYSTTSTENPEIFQDYNLKNTNCLLFSCNDGMFIPNSSFKIINNSTVQLIEKDILSKYSNTKKYIMYIFSEIEDENKNINHLSCETIETYILNNNQIRFNIPKLYGEFLPFLLIYNDHILFNTSKKQLYSVDNINHIILFKTPSLEPTNLIAEEKLKFAFLKFENRNDILPKFERIDFTLSKLETKSINITKYCTNINILKNNFLLFINGIHISQTYYKFTKTKKNDKLTIKITFNEKYQNFEYTNSLKTQLEAKKITYKNIIYEILYIKEYLNINNMNHLISQQNSINEEDISIQFVEIDTRPQLY